MTKQEQIVTELESKLAAAKAGKIECFFSVDIQRDSAGDPLTTVTCIPSGMSAGHGDALRNHLHGMVDIFREVYKK